MSTFSFLADPDERLDCALRNIYPHVMAVAKDFERDIAQKWMVAYEKWQCLYFEHTISKANRGSTRRNPVMERRERRAKEAKAERYAVTPSYIWVISNHKFELVKQLLESSMLVDAVARYDFEASMAPTAADLGLPTPSADSHVGHNEVTASMPPPSDAPTAYITPPPVMQDPYVDFYIDPVMSQELDDFWAMHPELNIHA